MPPKATLEKNYIVTVSVSQGKKIPFSSSIVKVTCGPETFEMARRGENPVYNESKELYLSKIPTEVKFTLWETHWIGSDTEKGRFVIPISADLFQAAPAPQQAASATAAATAAAGGGEQGQPVSHPRNRACPLSYNSFMDPNSKKVNAGSSTFSGSFESIGQLEVEVKCHLRDKQASLAYRDTLGVLGAKLQNTKDLKAPSKGDAHFIAINYGMQRYCSRGSTNTNFNNQQIRLWAYEQTRDYRIEMLLIERSAKDVEGGTILGRCLVSCNDFLKECQDASQVTTAKAECCFLPPPSSSTASDRDQTMMDKTTVEISSKRPPASASPSPMGELAKLPSVFVEFSFTPKAVAETIFFEGLWTQFDADNSGTLDKLEVCAMMDTLRVKMSDEEINKFIASVDSSGDGNLDHDEVMRLLRSGEFQSSALSSQMMQFLLDGKEGLERMVSGLGDAVKMVDGSAVRNTVGGEDSDDMGLLIFDRASGMMLHEHIPWYIKMALKSMYRSTVGMKIASTSKVRSMLVAQSKAEGVKMDHPDSRAKIPGFIEQYGLDMDEVLLPVSEFEHFNAFFYRKLKPGARPIASPGDNKIVVSPADCRMSVFKKMTDATKVWVKGNEFTVEKLLGPRKDLIPLFTNPTLVIARLAPQDYHRVHFPVSGKMGKITEIDGTLYTVNPIAVKSAPEANVYTENIRHILELKTEEFGTVVMIMVGATMVGSVNVNPQYKREGQPFKKGDDCGYFAFGGSTSLLLFQPGSIDLDADLQDFSRKPIEVLVKCSANIGKATGNFSESSSSAEASTANLRRYFAMHDHDNSGLLDRSEAIACVSMLLPDESVDRIVQLIRDSDRDGDGRLSFLEFCSIAKELQQVPLQRAALARRLEKFYMKYNESNMKRIPEVIEKYLGREDELFQALTQKYGPEPN